MRRADAQPKSPSSTPPRSLPLPPDLHCEYKRRHRNSLSSCFEELKTTPPRTPACRFTRVGGWDSGSESEDDRIVSPPAEGKFDDDDENDINELRWKSERILDLDGQEEKHDGTHEDAHHGTNTHFDNLDQGMLPGTNVIIKRSNLKAKILRKSLFHGQVRGCERRHHCPPTIKHHYQTPLSTHYPIRHCVALTRRFASWLLTAKVPRKTRFVWPGVRARILRNRNLRAPSWLGG